MKQYINDIKGDSLLGTIGYDKTISPSIEVNQEVITAYDIDDIAILDNAGFEEIGLLYSRKRAEAYPSLADQADMQFHDAVDGTTTWQDYIQGVKDTYPKPI